MLCHLLKNHYLLGKLFVYSSFALILIAFFKMFAAPVPPWFDAVCEASAKCVASNDDLDGRRLASVRRKLSFSSPIKGVYDIFKPL